MFEEATPLVKLNSVLDKTYPSPHRMADFLYYATELHVVVLLHKSSRGYLIKPRSKSGLHIIW